MVCWNLPDEKLVINKLGPEGFNATQTHSTKTQTRNMYYQSSLALGIAMFTHIPSTVNTQTPLHYLCTRIFFLSRCVHSPDIAYSQPSRSLP